jgi:hypothetical protein
MKAMMGLALLGLITFPHSGTIPSCTFDNPATESDFAVPSESIENGCHDIGSWAGNDLTKVRGVVGNKVGPNEYTVLGITTP